MSEVPRSIESFIANLENEPNSYMLKYDSYQSIQKALEQGVTVNGNEAERLLTVCCQDLKEDMQFTASALSTISALITKLKTEPFIQLLELLPSALAIIKIMKTICQSENLSSKIGVLHSLCFETLLSYPDQTLITLTTLHCNKLLDLIESYSRQNLMQKPTQYLDLLAFKLLAKLLEILPIERKQEFVTEGLSVWFSSVLPAAFACSEKPDVDMTDCIRVLESLTNSLLQIDYGRNPAWRTILENIINPTKYPQIMKKHLANGNDCWYRLWIVIVKLLKNEITKVNDRSGSPINALLPVVESAFKMDSKYRCEAFLCWNALIDNFSSQLNESGLNKRIKLLMVPLRSNNVKTDETAIAKLNTWWHLIRQLQTVMDEYIDMILIPFIHFCFGYVNSSGKVIISAGLSSDSVRRLSLQVLVEIIGHIYCENCVTIPKLKSKLINTKILVEHWKDWLYSIKSAIKTAASDTSEDTTRQCTCIWKSFLKTITELPANNLRNDLLLELVDMVSQFRQESLNDNKVADIVFNILIMSFFDDNSEFKTLFKPKRDDKVGPISKILFMLVNPCFDTYYKRLDKKELVSRFKQITNVIMDSSIFDPDEITLWILNHVLKTRNDAALLFWTALVQSTCESNHNLPKCNLMIILSWPLNTLITFSNEASSVAWYDWLTIYNMVNAKLDNSQIDEQISYALVGQIKAMKSPSCFLICASLTVLKSSLVRGTKYETEIDWLLKIMLKVEDYQSIERVFPKLVDTITLALNKLEESTNAPIVFHTLMIVEIILKLISQALKAKHDNVHDVLILTENLFKPLKRVMEVYCHICLDKYSKVAVVYELIDCLPFVSKDCSLHKDMISILNLFLSNAIKSKFNWNPALSDRINAAIKVYGNKHDDDQINADEKLTYADSPIQKFTTPDIKEASKKFKLKEPSIVNTVVENGEEFVVVKSNWKFNPRTLTENQKEKFKRKREDIPALYQDLSQSQDEFKLKTWKTDSQDTTTTSSKSTSKSAHEDVPTILKNMPNTDVVPTIIENILLESATSININATNTTTNTNVTDSTTDKSNIQGQQCMLDKDTKSPRMALKDRVFRNVRNLIEKTNLPKEDQLNAEHLNQAINENVCKTHPTPTQPFENLTNSAPPKSVYERPSRVIKKPKKFDDSELINIKKRRRISLDVNVLDIGISNKPVPKIGVQVDLTKEKELPSDNKKELYVVRTRRRSQNDSQKHIETIDKPVQERKLSETDKEKKLCSSSKNKLILSKRRRSETDSQIDNESSDKPVQQITVQAEVHKEKEDSSGIKKKVIVLKSGLKQDVDTKALQKHIEMIDTPVQERKLAETDKEKKLCSSSKKTLIFSKRRRSETDSQQDNESSDKPVQQITVQAETHKEKEESSGIKKKVIVLKSGLKQDVDTKALQKHIEMIDKSVQERELAETAKEKKLCSSSKKKLIFSKRRRSETDSQQDNESSDKPVQQITVQAGAHKEKEESSGNKKKAIVLKSDLQQDVEISAKPVLHKEKEASSGNKMKEGTIEGKCSQNDLQQDFEIVNKPVQQLRVQGDIHKVKDVGLDLKKDLSNASIKHSNNEIQEHKCDKSNKTDNKMIMQIPVGNTATELNINDKKKAKDRCNEKVDENIDTGDAGNTAVNVKLNSQRNAGTLTKEECLTPTSKSTEIDESTSVNKKKSRIEKQLLIDMVEGHPLLQVQSEKRVTRKTLLSTPPSISKRKFLQNKEITESKNTVKPNKKLKETDKLDKSSNISSSDSHQNLSQSSDDFPMSEDIIESSQDSSVTTISIKSAKHAINKKIPIVKLEKNFPIRIQSEQIASTQNLLRDDVEASVVNVTLPNDLSTEDIELSENKTAVEEKADIDLTENMDTQPIDVEIRCSDVISITDEEEQVIVITDTDNTNVGTDTLEIAEADTQTMEVEVESKNIYKETYEGEPGILVTGQKISTSDRGIENELNENPILTTQDDLTKTLSESIEASATVNVTTSGTCSPLMDEAQRTKDFMNDTIEISPIKTMSPLEEKNSSSPDMCSDYVVIKLTSPVQSNGEPLEDISHSPEIFTEDKVSPDKRDQSPPRPNFTLNNSSPSSSLSLKKNRPQVRSCRRAARMLSLLGADNDQVQTFMNSDRSVDSEETKKCNLSTTPARRNLRILYNSVGENNKPNESEDSENFLKFKKALPPVNCSPSVPILKRKLADIVDETATSPASKRKRVSFHDPPVSTTVAVEKYIDPIGIRSPQNTTLKRLEKQLRGPMKSPKRLDNVFKLDTMLTKAVESFNEDPSVISSIDDMEVSSMDETPAVEIVKTSDLNDTDPICADLLDCDDPIDNIAADLSSPAMKELFIKELKGKVETVADLAKMTELEVNRLCIKAPKVNVARKVLNHYASQIASKTTDKFTVDIDDTKLDSLTITSAEKVNVETQTHQVVTENIEVQTNGVPMTVVHTQTDVVPATHASIQTIESGSKSTKDIIRSCLSERSDFIEKLTEELEESSIQQIADKLSFNASIDLLAKKMTTSNAEELLKRLMLFYSQLLQKIHDKPS